MEKCAAIQSHINTVVSMRFEGERTLILYRIMALSAKSGQKNQFNTNFSSWKTAEMCCLEDTSLTVHAYLYQDAHSGTLSPITPKKTFKKPWETDRGGKKYHQIWSLGWKFCEPSFVTLCVYFSGRRRRSRAIAGAECRIRFAIRLGGKHISAALVPQKSN